MKMLQSDRFIAHISRQRWTLCGVAVAASLTANGCATVTETSPDSPEAARDVPTLQMPSIRLLAPSVVAIDSLVADRSEDTVAVSGTVSQRVAILDGWLYEVTDDTGRLWILTEQSEPTIGATATVEGILRYEPIVVGEIDAGDVYLEEQHYRQENN
ncbi:MAG: hypothetical protein AAFO84_02670 [Cyanobacteria bacterium J06598_1]